MIWNFNILHFLLLISSYGASYSSGEKEILITDPEGRKFGSSVCSDKIFQVDDEYAALENGLHVTPTQKEVVVIIGRGENGALLLARALGKNNALIPETANSSIISFSPGFYDRIGNDAYYAFPAVHYRDNLLLRDFIFREAFNYATKVKIVLACWDKGCLPELLSAGDYLIANISKHGPSIALVAHKDPEHDIRTIYDELEALTKNTDPGISSLAAALLKSKTIVPVNIINNRFYDESLNAIRKIVKKLHYTQRSDINPTYRSVSIKKISTTCLAVTKVGMELVTILRNHSALQEMHYLNSSTNINKPLSQRIHEFIEKLREDIAYVESSSKDVIENLSPSSHQLYGKFRDIVRHLIDPDSKKESPFLPGGERIVNFFLEMEGDIRLVQQPWLKELTAYFDELIRLREWYESLQKISDLDLSINLDNQNQRKLEKLLDIVDDSRLVSRNDSLRREIRKSVKLPIFNRNVTRRCIPWNYGIKMEVRGDIISMSYVNDFMCQGNVKLLEIFALDKVIIDVDLDLVGRETQVQVVGKLWEIIGNRLINVNGADGEKWGEPKAESGTTKGSKLGRNGKPGLPGGPAGTFYGIAKTIVNAEKLFVTADGGKGGPGQDGGDGGDGYDGVSFNPQDGWKMDMLYNIIPGFVVRTIKRETIIIPPNEFTSKKYFLVIGKLGYHGGDGGEGGCGGRGGYGGDVKIFELGQEPHGHINTSSRPGSIGKMGAGGRGGKGGKNGNDVEMLYYYDRDGRTYYLKQTIDKGYAESGLRREDGTYLLGRRPPHRLNASVITLPLAVNNYKNFIRENFADHVRNDDPEDLYNLLDKRSEITSLYTPLDLIEEFIDLENQYNRQENVTVLFPLYGSLMERLKKYMERNDLDDTNGAYKALFNEMSFDLEGKIKESQIQGDYPVIFSIRSEFDRLRTEEIDEVKKARTMESFTKIFHDSVEYLDADINEGRDLLNMIQMSIEDTEIYLDNNLNSLVAEVMYQREKQNENIDDLNEQARNLERSMERKVLFGMAKAILQALSLINPATAAVTAVALSTASILENSYKNQTTSVDLSISIPKELNLDFKAAEDFLTSKKEAMEKLIEKQEEIIEEAMKTLPEKDGEVLKRWKSLGDLKKEVESPKPLQFSYRTIESKLEAQKEELLNKSKIGEHKYTGAIKVFEKLQGLSQAAEAFGNVYKNVSADRVVYDNINTAIAQANENLKLLRQYEDSIYAELVPVLEGIRLSLNGLKEDFNNMSSIRLGAAKWDITGNLKNVREIIIKLTGNYTSQKEFTWTLEKLTDAVSKMINVNEKVKEIEKDKKDKNLHVSLHITGQQEIPLTWYISDSRVSRAFTILKLKYAKNSLKQAYSRWLYAYKQYLFPKSKHLVNLTEDLFSDQLHLDKAIKDIKNVLYVYSVPQNSEDPLKQSFYHNSRKITGPFHVWNKQQYSEEIGNLLSGKEIKLFADISEHGDTHAVKFNKINLTFYSEDEKLLRELNEDLNYFAANLTHEGNSFYRCGESIYLIKNAPTSLTYSLDPDFDYAANPYVRITGGDEMLSPYATWSIRLIKLSPLKNFGDLEKYKNKIDLELSGRASYYSSETIKCNSDLNEYYTSVDNVSELKKKI